MFFDDGDDPMPVEGGDVPAPAAPAEGEGGCSC